MSEHAKREPGAAPAKLDVLLVDDSEDDYVLTADLLADARDLSCHLNWVDGYAPALKTMLSTPPDICLLDYHLGAQTGLELLEEVRSQDISLPFILLTGADASGLNLKALKYGAVDYLVKSQLQSDVLERAIHGALERHRVLDTLTRMAMVDSLTGLANRSMFSTQVEAALSNAARHRRNMAVLYIDLNGFKQTNDRYGHAAGDQMLAAVSERIRSRVRSEDLVARIGGDEFAVLLHEVDHPGSAARVADKIQEAIGEPLDIGRFTVRCGASIGIATSRGELSGDVLLTQADAAMYDVKRSGRDGFRFYDDDLHAAARERARMEAELLMAADSGQLRVHYQPQVDLRDRTVTGVEALLRWQHPVHGLIGPGAFIAVAEESGAVESLGEWMLARACADYLELRERLPDLRQVAINVSTRQLSRGSVFVERVFDVLAASGMPPGALELELSETVGIDEARTIRPTLQVLVERGVRVAMDDFGAGNSTLAHLRELPVRTVKLDQSFIHGIESNEGDEAFVRAIVAMTRALDLTLIAEGVETERQAAYLGGLGCRRAQGFLYGAAKPLESLTAPDV